MGLQFRSYIALYFSFGYIYRMTTRILSSFIHSGALAICRPIVQSRPSYNVVWIYNPVSHYKRGPQRTLLQIVRQARQYKLWDSYTRVQERLLLYRLFDEIVVVLSTPISFLRTTPSVQQIVPLRSQRITKAIQAI